MNRRALIAGLGLGLATVLVVAWILNRPRTEAPAPEAGQARIVSVGGAVTEILYAIGAGEQIVGSDTTSMYPPAANEMPKVGYLRQLSAEGVLSLNPTLIIATQEAGPPHVIDQLRDAGVTVALIPGEKTREGLASRINAVAEAVRQSDAAAPLASQIEADWQRLQAARPKDETKPRILFIYARGGGVLNVSGTGTAAAAVISLIGGENAVPGYQGYRPLTAEAVVAAAPDVILMSKQGLEAVGGPQGLWQLGGMALTPAATANRVMTGDELAMLGFGPRTPAALADLAQALSASPDGANLAQATRP